MQIRERKDSSLEIIRISCDSPRMRQSCLLCSDQPERFDAPEMEMDLPDMEARPFITTPEGGQGDQTRFVCYFSMQMMQHREFSTVQVMVQHPVLQGRLTAPCVILTVLVADSSCMLYVTLRNDEMLLAQDI